MQGLSVRVPRIDARPLFDVFGSHDWSSPHHTTPHHTTPPHHATPPHTTPHHTHHTTPHHTAHPAPPTGGCALLPGLRDRLESELKRLSVSAVTVNIPDPSNPALTRNCAYMGAHLMTEIAVDNDTGSNGFVPYTLFQENPSQAIAKVLGKI